jgi:hypothetical protein
LNPRGTDLPGALFLPPRCRGTLELRNHLDYSGVAQGIELSLLRVFRSNASNLTSLPVPALTLFRVWFLALVADDNGELSAICVGKSHCDFLDGFPLASADFLS